MNFWGLHKVQVIFRLAEELSASQEKLPDEVFFIIFSRRDIFQVRYTPLVCVQERSRWQSLLFK